MALCWTAGSAQEKATPLAPLIISAQKVDQLASQVPITNQAFSGSYLEQSGFDSLRDLGLLTPGVAFRERLPSNPTYNIRGIASDSTDPRLEARVSVFQDGVSISRTAASSVELFDLERVEILKGPQGTLFGRAAEAGAIALVQRKPEPVPSASLTAGLGDMGARQLAGHGNTPFGEGRGALRIAFTAVRQEGSIENRLDGSPLQGRDTVAVRPSFRWRPGADTTVDVIVNYQRDRPPGLAFKSASIPTTAGDTDPFAPAELNRGTALGLDRTVSGATMLLEHRWSPTLSLHAITAFRAHDYRHDLDADGSRFYLLEFADDASGRQFSQEVRAAWVVPAIGRLVAGANYFHETGSQEITFTTDERAMWPLTSARFKSGLITAGVPAALVNAAVPNYAPYSPQPALPTTLALLNSVPALTGITAFAGAPLRPHYRESFSQHLSLDAGEVFVDASRQLSPRWEITAGARLSVENQTFGYEAGPAPVPSTLAFTLGAAPNFAVRPTYGRRQADLDETAWVGRTAIRFTPRDDLNLYASVSRGRRPGAIIVDATTTTTVREETLLSAEVGAKWRAGRRTELEAALFDYTYKHFQTVMADPTNPTRFIVRDAGAAHGRGGEFCAHTALGDGWTLLATYGYTDVTFNGQGADGQVQLYAGSTPRLTSRHTAGLGLTAPWRLGRAGQAATTLVVHYRSRHFFNDDNTAFGGTHVQSGYALVQLRTTWRSPAGRWELAARADNLLNRSYVAYAGTIGGNFNLPVTLRGEPRRWFFSATHRW